MRLRGRLALVSAAVMMWAAGAPAWAGDQVLYQPAPPWVVPLPLPEERPATPVLLLDDQRRIEEGRLWSYTDRAIRIDSPQTLNAAGTVQVAWMPDKGDLIVHRMAIQRPDGTEVDVIAGGAKFDVLRREMQLEERSIDGARTAALTVPGLRVGDVLRLSWSITLSDQALDREVQTFVPLPVAPLEVGAARLRLSWPEGAPVQWRQTSGRQPDAPVVKDGFATLEVALPLAEPPEMPDDAPVRFHMPPMLLAGTFADWQEVSRVMAPLYATDGLIAADPALAAQVAAIRGAGGTQLAQAVAALRLVQDEVAYLLNGMEGGNYIPQAPATTWEMRYGDCKAKSLLLLAMLRDLGIEAEATLVTTRIGDALPDMLPLPADFDHVIVRATVDGQDYWLDGTNSGASLAVVHEVPAFHHALPIRPAGAELVAMAQRPQQVHDLATRLTIDQRAGLDLPALFDGSWTVTGAAVAPFRAAIGLTEQEGVEDELRSFVSGKVGNALVGPVGVTYSEDDNSATIDASGVLLDTWEWDRGRGSRVIEVPSGGFQFRPNRSRGGWRDLPVRMAGPYWEQAEITVLLPDGAYTLQGKGEIEQEIAGVRLSRATELQADRLVVRDSAAWPGGEIAANDIAAARQATSRFGSTELRLRAPAGAQRRFDPAALADRDRLQALDASFAALIEADPDDMNARRQRAYYRASIFDHAGAVEDIGPVIAKEQDAPTLLWRSGLYLALDELDSAADDAERAWEMDPNLAATLQRAMLLRYQGRLDEGIAMLEDYGATQEEEAERAALLSDLEAQAGRVDEGFQRLDDLLAERPNDPALLNNRCWYQATWNYRPDDMADICTRAVENATWTPPVLDSRALAWFRLGQVDAALKDLDSALAINPEQSESLFLRGVIKQAMGDRRGGAAEIGQALALEPSLKRYYALFGITAE